MSDHSAETTGQGNSAKQSKQYANDNSATAQLTTGATNAISEDVLATTFTKRHGKRLKYCNPFKAWFEWTGTHWQEDDSNNAFHLMRQIAHGANSVLEKPDKTLTKTSTLKGALYQAGTDPASRIKREVWDKNPYLLGTPGGTVDLRTGELRPAQPEEYITQLTLMPPSEDENCPIWLNFLNQTTQGDESYIRYLKQLAGYVLNGDTREQTAIFVWGDGGNGKGTYINTLAKIMRDYAKTAPMSLFIEKKYDLHPTSLARLHNARLVTASELSEGRTWDEALIKQITGGDPIPAHFMGKDEFEYIPKFTPLFFGNRKPRLRVVDEGMKRRFLLAPFTNKPEKRNLALQNQLEKEAPGILRWAINGGLDWQKNGFVIPDVITTATAEYFEQQDRRQQWLDDFCSTDDQTAKTTCTELFKSWKDFVEEYGEHPGAERTLSTWLVDTADRGLTRCKNNGKRYINGIRVLTPFENDRQTQGKYLTETYR